MKKTISKICLFVSLLSFCIVQCVEAQNNNTNINQIDNDSIVQNTSNNLKKLLEHWYKGYTEKSTLCTRQPATGRPIITSLTDSMCIKMLGQMPSALRLSYNPDVRKAIDLFAFNRKDLLSIVLSVGDIYFPQIEMTLDRYNIPMELKYLSIIESGLNPTAVSRSGAAGLWQLMLPTGRIYGLKINSLVDERFDFVKSTDAACRLLTTLYNTYGDWWLAIAAYNCGPRYLNYAIEKAGGSKDFWKVYYYLPRETRRYIPLFIGAYFAMYYHDRFGIEPLSTSQSISTGYFTVKKAINFDDLSRFSGIGKSSITFFNPQYRREIIPGNIDGGCTIRLPIEGIMKLVAMPVDSIYSPNMGVEIQQVSAAYGDNPMGITSSKVVHRVRKGETIYMIARKYHVTVAHIKNWNRLHSVRLHVGQILIIYKYKQKYRRHRIHHRRHKKR